MSATSLAPGQGFDLAEKTLAAMRRHGSPAYPRAFEVWFAYLSGTYPALREGLDALLAKDEGAIGAAAVDQLYDAHLGNERFARQTERASLGVLGQIDSVMAMLSKALGNSERYSGALTAFSDVLMDTPDLGRVRSLVENLVVATREEVSHNRQLEAKLKDNSAEIRDLREALEATRAEALTDPLTGLANRRHFEEMLQKSIDQATLRREQFALVMADIDFFKQFNDTHGHLTGDQVLRLVARTMRDRFKTKAIITRFGGEEFAIILPESDLMAGRVNAETVRQTLLTRELVKRSTNESLGRITISLGVAVYRRGDTSVSIVERADSALLLAKRDGRNRTVTEDALEAAARVA